MALAARLSSLRECIMSMAGVIARPSQPVRLLSPPFMKEYPFHDGVPLSSRSTAFMVEYPFHQGVPLSSKSAMFFLTSLSSPWCSEAEMHATRKFAHHPLSLSIRTIPFTSTNARIFPSNRVLLDRSATGRASKSSTSPRTSVRRCCGDSPRR